MVSLTTPPLSVVDAENNDSRLFVQSISAVNSGSNNLSLEYIVLFGHPNLIYLAKSALHFYIDATFKTAPYSWKQVLIVMIYDAGSDLYIPVFYCLLQSKTATAYMMALAMIDKATHGEMSPTTFTLDFEYALISEIRLKFRRADKEKKIIGCFFHWKQAIRRWMIAHGNFSG
jgi:hypothetical protein